MMPIFFHAASHLWIFYLFFLNGLLIHYLLRSKSAEYARLTNPIEAQIVAAFMISISLNGVLLIGVDVAEARFSQLGYVLPVFTLAMVTVLESVRRDTGRIFAFEFEWRRLALYSVVFIILFYNGGLIEHVSDAWWHMSYANKIALANSFELSAGQLNGVHARYYPALWHGNLALAKTLSDTSLPVLWNSFTAWGAVIKVMGFYLLSLSLAGNRTVAFVSALLFFLLPGIGNSYMRVSSWPSHISYAAWFCLFYLMFCGLDQASRKPPSSLSGWGRLILEQRVTILALALLAAVVMFAHRAELLWFGLAVLAYFLASLVRGNFARADMPTADYHNAVFKLIGNFLLTACLAVALWFCYDRWDKIIAKPDFAMAYLLPAVTLAGLLFLSLKDSFSRATKRSYLLTGWIILCCIALLASIDTRQLISLFDPEQAYTLESARERALHAIGYFGEKLNVPGWHHQLRFGLLYSGILSVPLAIYLSIIRPSRLSLFTAGCGSLALLFCLSPYLYQWLGNILDYHSPWRIGIMIFHPIVMAAVLAELWQSLQLRREG